MCMWKNYLKMCIQFLFMDNKEFLYNYGRNEESFF
nr:MAG TPA: hypothetical protein [Caudoviricetes sp.]